MVPTCNHVTNAADIPSSFLLSTRSLLLQIQDRDAEGERAGLKQGMWRKKGVEKKMQRGWGDLLYWIGNRHYIQHWTQMKLAS